MLSTRNRINLQRENLLLKYEEAVQIAFKLGIKDGIDNSPPTPLYNRRYRALNIEK